MFNSLKIGDNDMKKMMILAVMMVMTISAKAMSYNAAITVVPATSEVAAKVIPFCSTICLETRTLGNLRNEVPFSITGRIRISVPSIHPDIVRFAYLLIFHNSLSNYRYN